MSQQLFIGNSSDFPLGQAKSAHADKVSVLVVHLAEGYYAIANKCPHLGLPLAGGKLEGNVITCPWHNSKFDVCTGRNLDWVGGIAGVKMPGWVSSIVALGKQPHGVTTYTVTEKEGKLYLQLSD
jgi:nitrite reductase/ring-hydroxylating ferredoxin subunit